MLTLLGLLLCGALPLVVGYVIASTGGMYRYELGTNGKVAGKMNPYLRWMHDVAVYGQLGWLFGR
jgi:hypothetical protein